MVITKMTFPRRDFLAKFSTHFPHLCKTTVKNERTVTGKAITRLSTYPQCFVLSPKCVYNYAIVQNLFSVHNTVDNIIQPRSKAP